MAKIDGMFFEYIFVRRDGGALSLSNASTIQSSVSGYPRQYAQKVIAQQGSAGAVMNVILSLEIPQHIREEVGSAYAENDESYAVEILQKEIRLYASTNRGLLYAISTLKQLAESGNISQMLIYDYPDKKIRGYRVYTPGKGQFTDFENVLDMLVEYKYNAMIIEIGGAMEYKRHPEINTKWVEFCKEVHQSPYEAHRIQKETHPQWQKNSIHADNGDGSFITQAEMRQLIALCREREMDVIPEVPSLSHCDYIVMAHPDIRERVADTYPDTYCPSNPKSYELVFDVLDEVIDVFQPACVNIGHDECYSLAKCPRCAGKDPVDLYVGDIIKINDNLKTKGIKAIMWAEKFFDDIYLPDENGVLHGFGGTGDAAWDVPRVFGCVGKIPKDVTLLHWYYALCELEQERHVYELGYPMLFGNLQGLSVKDYRARTHMFAGGFVSNWGSFKPEYMQRNAQNFNLLSTAWIFWSSSYDDSLRNEVTRKVRKALYQRHVKTLGENPIELVHTTDYFKQYKVFYDGFYIVPEDWTIGYHIVTYTDGTKAPLPVIYGYNIRSSNEEESAESSSEEAVPNSYVESIGASNPFFRDGKMYYRTAYRNPYPEKSIVSIRFEGKNGICVEAEYPKY